MDNKSKIKELLKRIGVENIADLKNHKDFEGIIEKYPKQFQDYLNFFFEGDTFAKFTLFYNESKKNSVRMGSVELEVEAGTMFIEEDKKEDAKEIISKIVLYFGETLAKDKYKTKIHEHIDNGTKEFILFEAKVRLNPLGTFGALDFDLTWDDKILTATDKINIGQILREYQDLIADCIVKNATKRCADCEHKNECDHYGDCENEDNN